MAKINIEAETLHQYIVNGRFTDQTQLPPERELAALLGLTRSRLRASLDKLERDGVIWRHVGKGTFIGSRPVIDLPPRMINTNPIDVMDARLVLEPELANRAALKATSPAIAEMRACVKRLDSDNYDHFEFWDQRLHREIALAADSPLLLSLFDVIETNRVAQVRGMQRRAYDVPDRLVKAVSEHAVIVDAISDREPVKAAKVMRDHLENVRSKLFGLGFRGS